MTEPALNQTVVDLLRELTPQVLGVLARRHTDFDAAEDAVQEATIAAAGQWPREGLPENPMGWLIQVATRRLIDHIRNESARRRRESELAYDAAVEAESSDHSSSPQKDDTLALFFMCCHPALTTASAIALTLRAVGGLNTPEIARAFLVPEPTMAQRLSRAKQTIKRSNIPFQLPPPDQRDQRLRTVLHVLYLMFSEGYVSSDGPVLYRVDLAREAIRLTRMIHALLPEHAEAAGLIALFLLTDARRPARADATGALIPLMQQDRSLWNKQQIAEGVAILSAALPRGSVGPYQLQAAIAAIHDESVQAADTDWPQILVLYAMLRRMTDNPVIALNHAIAVAMVLGPERGLAQLEDLAADPRLAGQHRLDAARAHLLERTGDRDEAARYYRSAASKTTNLPERQYLLRQAAGLQARSRTP